MSTILDALNKLDDEKKKTEAASRQGDSAPIDPAEAAKDIIGKDVMRDELTFRFSPLQIIGAIAAGAIILIVVVVSIVLGLVRPNTPVPDNGGTPQPPTVKQAGAIPSQPTTVTEPTPEKNVAHETTAKPPVEKKSEPAPTTPEPQAAAQETPSASKPAQTKPEPLAVPELKENITQEKNKIIAATPTQTSGIKKNTQPKLATPDITPELEVPKVSNIIKAPPTETTQEEAPALKPTEPRRVPKKTFDIAQAEPIARSPIPEKAQPTTPKPVDIRRLPILSRAVLSRFDLNKVRINMCNPETNTNPYPNVIVNMIRMDVGDSLAGTTLELTHVEKHGAAFQDRRTGQQYYLKY